MLIDISTHPFFDYTGTDVQKARLIVFQLPFIRCK